MAETVADLRGVFNLCNPDEDGFILTEYLADKLALQFNHHALIEIQDRLDPHHKGRISFEEFCNAVNTLQGNETLKHLPDVNENDSSDPENTYNEYDLPEDSSISGEMENFEANGHSPFNLSPNKIHESSSAQFQRHGSFRRSHRRARSWNMKGQNIGSPIIFEPKCDETSSLSSEYEDLSEKVDNLQDHVSRLTEEKDLQAQYETVKRENHVLTHRANELEEKVQDMSERAQDLKKESKHKLQDLQRENDLQTQVLQSRIDMLTSTKERLEGELAVSRLSAKECREAFDSFQNKTDELTRQIMETNEEYRRLNQRFTQQQDRHEEEEHKLREELSDARTQMDTLHHEKNDLAVMLEVARTDPLSARLKAHVDKLKAENNELQVKNDDLTVQLAQNVADARSLMCNDGQSIAQELSSATKDEVMDALRKQEEINEQLRDYLDRITLNILERDPEILEIK